jgi:hypothetical protein
MIEIIDLQHWKFALERDAGVSDLWSYDFDDSRWQDVIVPHDWAVSFPFSTSHSSGTGYLPGGIAWYRTAFSVKPDEGRQRKLFVHFDGVYKNSQVWCNGYYLGRRPSGYSGFRYDISHCVRRDGAPTVIAVKVSHDDIADSRWYTGSGIYRKVQVMRHDPVYIPAETLVIDSSRCGEDGSAEVLIRGAIQNDSGRVVKEARISFALCGAGGITHSEQLTRNALAPHDREAEAVTFEARITVSGTGSQPLRWSPADPNLYELRIAVNAVLDDGWETCYAPPPLRIGIRSIRFDPDRGFFLNDTPLKIKGVCIHHDAGCLGAAVWPDVWRRRLLKLKAMGCNAIRTSHNPHMDELYDLCDELGFLVMEEAFDEWEGCKNKWTRGHNVYPPVHQGYYEDFPQWHERDLAGMVIRGRNHPCIVLWSIGNEIDYPNDPYCHHSFQEMTGNNDHNKPTAEMRYNPAKPGMERLAVVAADLVRIVKRHDQSRPVLAAAAFPELSSRLGFFDALDMAGYNYKEHLYEADHRRFPRLPIIGSENGHSRAAWKAVTDHDYISGQFLWTGIDYLGEARGWPVRGSGSGLLDTAGFEKIAYFRRKALWSDAPTLYLAAAADHGEDRLYQSWELSRSWNYMPGAGMLVVCYTNLEGAELLLNGTTIGAGTWEHDGEYLAWRIPFERGRLEVRGIAADGAVVADALESHLPAARLALRIWQSEAAPARAGAYCLYQIEAILLDEHGRHCVDGDRYVEVSLTGPGRLLGLENGDLADCDEYAGRRRRTFCGRLIIYVLTSVESTEPVDMTEVNMTEVDLTVSAAGLEPEQLRLPRRVSRTV